MCCGVLTYMEGTTDPWAPSIPERPFQTQVPSSAPEAPSRPLTSRPKPHVPCPGTTCPAQSSRGHPSSPGPDASGAFLHLLPALCDFQEQRTLPSPLCLKSAGGQPAPAHLVLFLGLRFSKDQNQQKQ